MAVNGPMRPWKWAVWAVMAAAGSAGADVRLPGYMGDHMVLQRQMPLPIWGWAQAGETVTVSLAGQTARTAADGQGRWKVVLEPLRAGGPVELVVQGKNTLTIRDVLIGEVWVGSGQSNMQWPVRLSADWQKEIAAAKYPRIRLVSLPMAAAGEPREDLRGDWQACSPETIPWLSAVSYYFGRELHRELDVPIGLIGSSVPGSSIEPWIPASAMAPVASLQKAAAEARKPATRPLTPEDFVPTTLYNAMIHPLAPLAVRGVIWYQGESNLADGAAYAEKMTAMVAAWRKAWGRADLPFYYVQIAPFSYDAKRPDLVPAFWEAQAAALAIPDTGMAVTIDLGDLTNIHPIRKQEVGRRLALWALTKTYGRDVVYSGPTFRSMAVKDSQALVAFDHAGGGLVTRDGGAPTGFAIAGADGVFVPARAAIEGAAVRVWSETVKVPAAVRFGWDLAICPNLINKEGLPAGAFRAVARASCP